MNKCAMPLLVSTILASSAVSANSGFDVSDWTFKPGVEVKGGVFINDHLQQYAAGREHQLKMSEVIMSMGFEKGSLKAKVEGALVNDEIKVVPSDGIYQDIYRNSGTSLYYYGEQSVREAYVGQFEDDFYWRAGRLITLNGEKPGSSRYAVAQEAPHAVLFNTGILNGVQAGGSFMDGRIWMEGGLLWGRDRPCLDAQCYMSGRLDVNEKGNNTPAVEVKATYTPSDWLSVHAAALYNKTGSAPGSYTSGKHNDERYSFGVSARLMDNEHVTLTADAVMNRYVIGLTEDGTQGETTPNESYDIERDGFYVTTNLSVKKIDTALQLTYESLDRADEKAFQNIAGFDPSHPVMSETETRTIVSVVHDFGYGLNVRGFYRMDDVPMLPGSDAELEDRAGIVMTFKTNF